MGEAKALGHSPVLLTQSDDPLRDFQLREELHALHDRLTQLNHLLRDAIHRQRFGPGLLSMSDAAADEQRYLAELNTVMTRIRAVEGQLLLRKRCLH
jgi:hypothetical protein